MVEKKTTKTAATRTAVKKTAAKKTTAKKVLADLSAQNVGFKAGDVYNALAAAGSSLSVEEIAKAAKISAEEVLLGLGWLLKEGKAKGDNDKVALA